ncbi:MAG: pseudouridine synthase [Gammaproteobacteria bacterium]|nr:pseudouridine synthase [Gammaproteobacteria bacterium]MBU1656263.1 pseudouridine synthase [Gammaproteobacteria bacterium]MBU1959828.1 pseudouridine synthase [Gammaproteobacteria bacterium]
MRLDRFISNNASLTRSEAQRAIRTGRVSVDEATVTDPAWRVGEESSVRFEGAELGRRRLCYLMLNKPAGLVCATRDGEHRTVLDLIPGGERGGLHPAGRLDKDTTGLVLLTDDGAWSHRVTSPRGECAKVYRVGLAEPLPESARRALEQGVELRGERRPTLPAEVEVLGAREIRLTLQEGKYHQVKRMLAAVGNRVISLERERIGAISLDPALAPGAYRPLTPDEVASVGSHPSRISGQ